MSQFKKISMEDRILCAEQKISQVPADELKSLWVMEVYISKNKTVLLK